MNFTISFGSQYDGRMRIFARDIIRAELLDNEQDDSGVDDLTDGQLKTYIENNVQKPYLKNRVRQHELTKQRATSEGNYTPID